VQRKENTIHKNRQYDEEFEDLIRNEIDDNLSDRIRRTKRPE